MANLNRLRMKDGMMIVAVDSATVIEKGDLLWLDTDDAKPVSSFTWDTNLATTQGNLQPSFIGVAMSASKSGNTDDVVVATMGVFEYPDSANAREIGDLIGPAKAAGNALLNQSLDTAVTAGAIGTVVKAKGATGNALIRIHPEKAFGIALGG
jgi:hypothetical protein